MQSLNAFRDLTRAGSRLGFFTRQTRDDIPATPGCYGWFLPLWLLHKTLPDFLHTFGTVMTHETGSPRELDAGFVWDRVKIKARRGFDPSLPPLPSFAVPLWDRLNERDETRNALQQILLQASLLTSPLYVGKTDNLRRRYNEHLTGSHFHTRFADYAKQCGLELPLSHLIFVCIQTSQDVEDALSEGGGSMQEVEKLVEEILKRLCRPPFSQR